MKHLMLSLLVLFTASCGSPEDEASKTSAVGTCLKMEMKTQCINRPVCKTVCSAGAAAAGSAYGSTAGAAAGWAGGGTVCSEVCDMLPQCSEVAVCVQYDHQPY